MCGPSLKDDTAWNQRQNIISKEHLLQLLILKAIR